MDASSAYPSSTWAVPGDLALVALGQLLTVRLVHTPLANPGSPESPHAEGTTSIALSAELASEQSLMTDPPDQNQSDLNLSSDTNCDTRSLRSNQPTGN
ncbi:unnamed protein product [Microthlaspi erraticum]|uniref:Uncharacterized protein n=1 Tax=Microthlaspi erraticum TaxID=1685480 RepID=A0A6D2K0K3_9BRAS|nr:unnamed protein product [Microthlaspi erraticum]CAA7049977.1 unnamed protein product [Microthlaspi erraticum]